MAVKGGSLTDRVYDSIGGYIKIMVVVGLLFGVATMLSLNALFIDVLANLFNGMVDAVTSEASTFRPEKT